MCSRLGPGAVGFLCGSLLVGNSRGTVFPSGENGLDQLGQRGHRGLVCHVLASKERLLLRLLYFFECVLLGSDLVHQL